VIAGLPNFGAVTPTLYRGAQPTRQGLRKLKEMGFDIVVDFRVDHDAEKRFVTSLGMEYVAIPWNCVHPEDEDIAMFLSLLRSHPGKKIFVHCRDGIDRTGMGIAAFRIVEQGWSEKDARKEMQAFGFSRLHRTICLPLVPYEANFSSRFQKSPAFEALRQSSNGTGPSAK
jgi:tyrosine-protein phosphatase SIW14